MAARLARIADRCVRMARALDEGHRDGPPTPQVDRFDSALGRLRASKPAVVVDESL